jgi:hypothetical protein
VFAEEQGIVQVVKQENPSRMQAYTGKTTQSRELPFSCPAWGRHIEALFSDRFPAADAQKRHRLLDLSHEGLEVWIVWLRCHASFPANNRTMRSSQGLGRRLLQVDFRIGTADVLPERGVVQQGVHRASVVLQPRLEGTAQLGRSGAA